jgi:methionyl aminopeptidase
MSQRKSSAQIEKMRQAGLLVWKAHHAAAERIAPGVTTAEINEIVETVIVENGGIPLFKGVPGKTPFPAGTCISVNEEIVHGIPGPRKLREGDVVSLDIGVKLDGWCGDAAVTHPVGAISPEARRLLTVTEEALRLAIRHMKPGVRWSRVAEILESHVVDAGFFVIEDLVGHGIGRQLWERPQVPNFVPEPESDFTLQAGMVLAVEPMVSTSTQETRILADHWTYVTADGGYAAHFEHTLAVLEDGTRALTTGPDGQGWAL